MKMPHYSTRQNNPMYNTSNEALAAIGSRIQVLTVFENYLKKSHFLKNIMNIFYVKHDTKSRIVNLSCKFLGPRFLLIFKQCGAS